MSDIKILKIKLEFLFISVINLFFFFLEIWKVFAENIIPLNSVIYYV